MVIQFQGPQGWNAGTAQSLEGLRRSVGNYGDRLVGGAEAEAAGMASMAESIMGGLKMAAGAFKEKRLDEQKAKIVESVSAAASQTVTYRPIDHVEQYAHVRDAAFEDVVAAVQQVTGHGLERAQSIASQLTSEATSSMMTPEGRATVLSGTAEYIRAEGDPADLQAALINSGVDMAMGTDDLARDVAERFQHTWEPSFERLNQQAAGRARAIGGVNEEFAIDAERRAEERAIDAEGRAGREWTRRTRWGFEDEQDLMERRAQLGEDAAIAQEGRAAQAAQQELERDQELLRGFGGFVDDITSSAPTLDADTTTRDLLRLGDPASPWIGALEAMGETGEAILNQIVGEVQYLTPEAEQQLAQGAGVMGQAGVDVGSAMSGLPPTVEELVAGIVEEASPALTRLQAEQRGQREEDLLDLMGNAGSTQGTSEPQPPSVLPADAAAIIETGLSELGTAESALALQAFDSGHVTFRIVPGADGVPRAVYSSGAGRGIPPEQLRLLEEVHNRNMARLAEGLGTQMLGGATPSMGELEMFNRAGGGIR